MSVSFTLQPSESGLITKTMHPFRARVRERMNQLQEIEVEIACTAGLPEPPAGIDALAQFEGTTMCLSLTRKNRPTPRLWTAMVVEARIRHVHGEKVDQMLDILTLVLRPHFSQLTFVHGVDVFTEKTLLEVINETLEKFPQVALEMNVDPKGYPKRDMFVRFRESEHAFLSRWLEHLGLFYYFKQQTSGDTLVIGDATEHYGTLEHNSEVNYVSGGETQGGVFELEERRTAIYDYYLCRDYNPASWHTDLTGEVSSAGGYAGGYYEYGGHFDDATGAQQLADRRAQRELARQHVLVGRSDVMDLAAGHVFSLHDHPRCDGSKLLVEVEHQMSQPLGWGLVEGDVDYQNRFVAIDANKVYRPPCVTPIPKIHGLFPGIIHNPIGEVAHNAMIDAEGRYRVRMLFDPLATSRAEADVSLPVRMLQLHSGERYGVHFPLKPGLEVAVGFMDGNPDRPVIVGTATNNRMHTPVDVADRTRHRIKTRTGILIEIDDNARINTHTPEIGT